MPSSSFCCYTLNSVAQLKKERKNTMILCTHDLQELNNSLLYLKMAELKNICQAHQLPDNGNKIALINRIVTFIQTGKILTLPIMPDASKAKKGTAYPLEPHTRMLSGES